jgi:hypothetical protein
MDYERVRLRLVEAERRGTRETLCEGEEGARWGRAWIAFMADGSLPLHPRRVSPKADRAGVAAYGRDHAEYRKRDYEPTLARSSAGGVRVTDAASLPFALQVDVFVAALQLAAEDEKAV